MWKIGKVTYDEKYVDTREDTPQIRKGYKHISVPVMALTENGMEVLAYYDDNYAVRCWRREDTDRKIHNIIGWRSLDE